MNNKVFLCVTLLGIALSGTASAKEWYEIWKDDEPCDGISFDYSIKKSKSMFEINYAVYATIRNDSSKGKLVSVKVNNSYRNVKVAANDITESYLMTTNCSASWSETTQCYPPKVSLNSCS